MGGPALTSSFGQYHIRDVPIPNSLLLLYHIINELKRAGMWVTVVIHSYPLCKRVNEQTQSKGMIEEW